MRPEMTRRTPSDGDGRGSVARNTRTRHSPVFSDRLTGVVCAPWCAGTLAGRPSHPARANRWTTRLASGSLAAGAMRFGVAGSQQSMSCSGARQVLVLKRIPMRNSLVGVEHRQDCWKAANAGMCPVRTAEARWTKRPPPAEATKTGCGQSWKLLRMRPTARPSISNASPGSTMMVL